MSMDWKKCFLNVPLNNIGLEEHNILDNEWKNIYTVELSVSECSELFDVFEDWNDKFNIIIDIFEEEILSVKSTPEAMKILENHIINSNDRDFLAAAQKLRIALNKALEVEMPLYLDF